MNFKNKQMKYLTLTILFLMITAGLFSQDIIMKTDGSQIKAKVLNIGDAEVYYKDYENQFGRTLTEDKEQVAYVKYESGTKVVIKGGEFKEESKKFWKKEPKETTKETAKETTIDNSTSSTSSEKQKKAKHKTGKEETSSEYDIIKKIDGSFIHATGIETGASEIIYRDPENIFGPTQSVGKNEIEYIRYKSGKKDVFKEEIKEVAKEEPKGKDNVKENEKSTTKTKSNLFSKATSEDASGPSDYDLIKKNDGTSLKVAIMDVLATEVRYKDYDNFFGATQTLEKTEISFIKYKTGKKEIITEAAKPVPEAVAENESSSKKSVTKSSSKTKVEKSDNSSSTGLAKVPDKSSSSLVDYDLIKKSDETFIKVNIVDASENEVRYKEYNNFFGATQSIDKKDIAYVKYKSGKKDFESETEKQKAAQASISKEEKIRKVAELENKRKEAKASNNYAAESKLNSQIISLNGTAAKTTSSSGLGGGGVYSKSSSSASLASDKMYKGEGASVVTGEGGRLKDIKLGTVVNKYRRSSIFIMMVDHSDREHAYEIRDAFMNGTLPDKFNDHSLNERMIQSTGGGNQTYAINNYLSSNGVAKAMVAKWFNRTEKGTFDMNLVKERGAYDATELDINIAKKSARGMAVIEDAGEELIGNTFIVVNEFKYLDKEEVGKQASTGLAIFGALASAAGYGDLATVANVGSVATAVAAKGFTVRTISYLYRLDWTPEIAKQFYDNYWMDDSNFDPAKKQAFENSNLFTLHYVGNEEAWADVQSTAFSSATKGEEIHKATLKATNRAIAKLQYKFDEFKIKTPLYTASPTITAQIGEKEGVERGNKYEVLEGVQDETGHTYYNRKGVIKVKSVYGETTTFIGNGNFYPGILIRQIR